MPLRITEGIPLSHPTRRREPATELSDERVAADERNERVAADERVAARGAGGDGRAVKAKAATSERKLGVPRRRQQQPDWCWAACVDMVLHYYGLPAVEQCEIVGRKLGEDCCVEPVGDEYSVPCAPKWVRGVWAAWGIDARTHLPRKGRLGWISEAALKRELEASRPVEVGLRWNNGGGHAVVVRGWRAGRGGVAYFYVNDPWNWAGDPRAEYFAEGVGQVSYKELRTGYGMGRWAWTWTGIGPKG